MLSSLLAIDRALTTWIAAQLDAVPVQWLLAIVTTLGVGGSVWFALAIAGGVAARRLNPVAVERVRGGCWRAMLAIALALALVDGILKPIVRRDRPFIDGPAPSALVWKPTTSSFPSGHAASSAAGAIALARAWPPAAVPLTLLSAAIVLSRVGLGVHYVADVLAGVLLGLAVAAFVSPRIVRRDDPDRLPAPGAHAS